MAGKGKPLVLDLDGTLLRTDMLFECLWAGLARNPIGTLSAIVRNLGSLAAMKQELASLASLRTDLLPVNEDILALARQAEEAGRPVVVASASDISLVRGVADCHGTNWQAFGSDGVTNLKGQAKAALLTEKFGAAGFDYAGDSSADMAVWQAADACILVGSSAAARTRLDAAGHGTIEVGNAWRMRDLLRALRPHQWVKNVLLLLPMLAAHAFELPILLSVIWGMVAFSAAASAIYIVNDLLDLEADRQHETKNKRPFAAGTVPIQVGMVAFLVCVLTACLVAISLNVGFLAVVLLYMVISLAYSLRLKRMRWIDIATLASLYTIRVVGGAAAASVSASGFMLVFVFPIFVALGAVKRMTELALAEDDTPLPGRGYSRRDQSDLLNFAWLGLVGALVTFTLYTVSEQAIELYPTRWMLWLALVPMAFWILRMIRLGYFGKMDYDPIVFALRDKRGLGLLSLILSMMFYAAGLWQEWFGL